jgi:hypothetical protein
LRGFDARGVLRKRERRIEKKRDEKKVEGLAHLLTFDGGKVSKDRRFLKYHKKGI